ncbi:hypothetical protein NXS19_011300 [Fusarium pseudograminearum]|nr:hypothetical protein NXS19_011300 [Fusarium pseudograminearum]
MGSHVSAQIIGGIVVTYTTWRAIYGLQAGMTLLGLILACYYLPQDTEKSSSNVSKHNFRNVCCGLLSFNLYRMLIAIRFAINERFNFPSPLASSLFYLVPGTGFVLGSIIGCILSDVTVKRYVLKRNGFRLSRDRLRAGLINMLVIPLGNLAFRWSLGEEVGGMALPAAGAFCAGFILMASFSSLNTYAAEVLLERRREIISCKYIF